MGPQRHGLGPSSVACPDVHKPLILHQRNFLKAFPQLFFSYPKNKVYKKKIFLKEKPPAVLSHSSGLKLARTGLWARKGTGVRTASSMPQQPWPDLSALGSHSAPTLRSPRSLKHLPSLSSHLCLNLCKCPLQSQCPRCTRSLSLVTLF